LPTSIYEINSMPEKERDSLLSVVIPRRFLETFSIDPETFRNDKGVRCVRFVCPERKSFFQVDLRRDPGDRDAVYFLDISTSAFGQMEISFVIVNDPDGERFSIDVDQEGQDTYFGTTRRNIPEEIRAMKAGLSPGQVRRGLKAMRDCIACWEEIFRRLGHRFFFLEPLTYNSAILYERCGFQYLHGGEKMREIDRAFRPGGALLARLDGSTPFRMPGQEKTVRGRSWAIHDGILDEPWESPKMHKTIGVHAGVSTFTGEGY
jgi:hypothetical protein